MKPAGQIDREGFSPNPSEGLEQIMSRYGNQVLRTAFFYMKDRQLAEDVSQEVFLKAYRHWGSFRGDSRVLTWLTRITIHTCLDKMKVKSYQEQPTDPVRMMNAPTGSVEEEVLKRLDKTKLFKHIVQLAPHYQEVLYHYYYLDLNTREIAEATATAEGTIRGRLHRAREQLAEILRKEGMVP